MALVRIVVFERNEGRFQNDRSLQQSATQGTKSFHGQGAYIVVLLQTIVAATLVLTTRNTCLFAIPTYCTHLTKQQRIISGELFEESWIELDAEVEKYENEYKLES